MNQIDQLSISREQLAQASALFDLMQAAQEGNRDAITAFGAALSYTPRRPRAFASLKAAVAAQKILGEAGARALLGGAAYRDYLQFAQQPDVRDVHVDAVLTNISVAYRNPQYIGPLAIPRVQVKNRSDVYFIFDKANLRRNTAIKRAPGGAANRSGYGLATGNYSVVTRTQEHVIPHEVRGNADSPLDPDRDGVQFATDILDLEYEIEAYTLLHTTGNWTQNLTLTGGDQWSDYDDSDPLADWAAARLAILGQCTKPANTLQLGYQVFEKLALHPDLLDRCKYSGTNERPAMVTAQMMSALAMVEQCLVGSALQNTADEGQADSLSFIWGKHAWMGHVAPQPALATPSAGYAFTTGREVDTYEEPQHKSTVVRVEEAWDMKKVDAGAGFRFINAVA